MKPLTKEQRQLIRIGQFSIMGNLGRFISGLLGTLVGGLIMYLLLN